MSLYIVFSIVVNIFLKLYILITISVSLLSITSFIKCGTAHGKDLNEQH